MVEAGMGIAFARMHGQRLVSVVACSNVREWLQRDARRKVVFHWCPSHMGIEWNELVNKDSKRAVNLPLELEEFSLAHARDLLAVQLKADWREEYQSGANSVWTFVIVHGTVPADGAGSCASGVLAEAILPGRAHGMSEVRRTPGPNPYVAQLQEVVPPVVELPPRRVRVPATGQRVSRLELVPYSE